jgi:hypothetical protein
MDAIPMIVDFFDWSQSDWLDFRYYLVSIDHSTKYPALAGHRALLEITYVVCPGTTEGRELCHLNFESYALQVNKYGWPI